MLVELALLNKVFCSLQKNSLDVKNIVNVGENIAFFDQQEKGKKFTHSFAKKGKNFDYRSRGKGRTFVIDVRGRGRRLVIEAASTV